MTKADQCTAIANEGLHARARAAGDQATGRRAGPPQARPAHPGGSAVHEV